MACKGGIRKDARNTRPGNELGQSQEKKKLGRSEKWIQQRMTGQETRNKLTDY